MMRRILKGLLIGALLLAATVMPVARAHAADLAFPILFVPIWSQNESVAGAFTDTRITIFNPSYDTGAAPCTVGFDVIVLLFDKDEKLIGTPSVPMSCFDVAVVTGPTLPNGTGTAVLINTIAGTSPPVVAFANPLAAVTEISAKTASGVLLDPLDGSQIGVMASEAQFIPALAGEFPRVEVTTTAGPPDGSPVLFPAGGFETVIVETCLLSGIVHNFVVDDNETFLFDVAIPCTGINSVVPPAPGPFPGPDLLIWTPDDGGLLGTPAAAHLIPPAGYHLLAIDVNTFGGPLLTGETLFWGQAGVFLPTPAAGARQAYDYNMPANYFATRANAPAASNGPDDAICRLRNAMAAAVDRLCDSVAGAKIVGLESTCEAAAPTPCDTSLDQDETGPQEPD